MKQLYHFLKIIKFYLSYIFYVHITLKERRVYNNKKLELYDNFNNNLHYHLYGNYTYKEIVKYNIPMNNITPDEYVKKKLPKKNYIIYKQYKKLNYPKKHYQVE